MIAAHAAAIYAALTGGVLAALGAALVAGRPRRRQPPVVVYRVPTRDACAPRALHRHPDLAHLDQQLDQLAAYYPAPERSD